MAWDQARQTGWFTVASGPDGSLAGYVIPSLVDDYGWTRQDEAISRRRVSSRALSKWRLVSRCSTQR